MKYKIYTLFCPVKKSIIYVGQTKNDLPVRLREHISRSKRDNAPISKYLRFTGTTPAIELLEYSSNPNYDERYWINQFAAWGFSLLNVCHNNIFEEIKGEDVNMSTKAVRTDKALLEKIRKIAKVKGQTIAGYINVHLERPVERDWVKYKEKIDGLQ